MAGFSAAAAVDPLDYDFNPYVDLKGTIPEPSDKQANKYLRKWQEIVQGVVRANTIKLQDYNEMTPEQRKEHDDSLPKTIAQTLDAMNNLSFSADPDDPEGQSETEQVADAMCKITSEVTGGHLTEAALLAIPYRPRAAFFGWLVAELTSPEKGATGPNTTLRAV